MLKDLTPRERLVLARIMMPLIVKTLDGRDFGAFAQVSDDPRMNYVRPHLGISGLTLLDKYLAKLSPTRRQWIDDNCECIIIAGSTDLRPSEIPYYKNLAKILKQKNGGILPNDRRKERINNGRSEAKPTKQVDGKDSSPKQKK